MPPKKSAPPPASPKGQGAPARGGRWRRAFRRLVRVLSAVALALVIVWATLMALWAFVPPVSTLMAARYLTFRAVDRRWLPLERFSPGLVASVLASEDSQFCRHSGVDFDQLRTVIAHPGKDGPRR
ncbi:MAG: transglycosylase domain-containing protein, partial [Hyphomicrobiales bacterium]|nr:transglycosylase domain-containing protein [Hyphomicrobiales bacterium]